MPRYKGVGPRIKARLLDLGYRQRNGEPDVARFCLDHRYDRAIFHEWSSDRSTPTKALERLAKDLQTTEAYLIFGIDALPATTTGSARRAATTLAVGRPRERRRFPRRPVGPYPWTGRVGVAALCYVRPVPVVMPRAA